MGNFTPMTYSVDSLHGDEHLQPEYTTNEYRNALNDIEQDIIDGKIAAADFLENEWPEACQMLIKATHCNDEQWLIARYWINARISAYAERHVDERMAKNREAEQEEA